MREPITAAWGFMRKFTVANSGLSGTPSVGFLSLALHAQSARPEASLRLPPPQVAKGQAVVVSRSSPPRWRRPSAVTGGAGLMRHSSLSASRGGCVSLAPGPAASSGDGCQLVHALP